MRYIPLPHIPAVSWYSSDGLYILEKKTERKFHNVVNNIRKDFCARMYTCCDEKINK